MLAVLSEVDHPAVRLNFDTGNIAYYNRGLDPCDELKKVKNLVANVHMKDNRGGYEDWYFPALGEGGRVNFASVKEILDSVDYDGACTIEIEGIEGEEEPGLEVRQERIAQSVRHLKACGFAAQ
jgi:inosose dehydratase